VVIVEVFDAFTLGDVRLLYQWLEESIGAFEYESPKKIPEPHSYYYERRGKGWRFKFIVTLNYLDQYPDNFAKKEWHKLGVEMVDVRTYAVVEIDSDADAVMFKLRWIGHVPI
jgi:hypothetical protein